MKKIILTITIGLLCLTTNGQPDSLKIQQKINKIDSQINTISSEVEALKNRLKSLKANETSFRSRINYLYDRNSIVSTKIDSLNDILIENTGSIENLNNNLEKKEKELEGDINETRARTEEKITSLHQSLSRNTLYWIMAVLVVGIITFFAYFFLNRKLISSCNSIILRLTNTRKELESEAIRLDERLITLMDKQLNVMNEEQHIQSDEPDHSLALKVADEIVRIEKNLKRMEEDTKGRKQLKKAVERIKDNFAANGYEMVELLGKPFNEGMKLNANFRPDETLKPNERIITRVIKPQINYRGEMIQSALVEVSQGE